MGKCKDQLIEDWRDLLSIQFSLLITWDHDFIDKAKNNVEQFVLKKPFNVHTAFVYESSSCTYSAHTQTENRFSMLTTIPEETPYSQDYLNI